MGIGLENGETGEIIQKCTAFASTGIDEKNLS
jgi:hypothetical protein